MAEIQQEQKADFIEQLFALFDTGEEAISYLNEHSLSDNLYLLEDLQNLCTALANGIEQLSLQVILKNKLQEIGRNAPLSVKSVLEALKSLRPDRANMEYQCSFVPLFLFWRRYAEFFLIHAVDDDALKAWHEAEREWFRQVNEMPEEDGGRQYKYDLSIVVLFYGNKKMTKECLDAIKLYTKNHSYELITFDNGSDPETTAWCNSLPHVKKIYYQHNMGSSLACNLIYTMSHLYLEGKYLMYISNDVIVTPRYDTILYQCMESDTRIALAAPVCNSASNLQAIPVPYQKNNMAAMQRFAESYNHPDPHKWSDRARLFAILGCYRVQVLQKMYLAFDPMFCYDMFADDDHSCSLRRMGYRQVLCRDAFVHHYGSATIGAGQFEVMDLGREQFYKKHGVDAWNSLGTELCGVLNGMTVPGTGTVSILALNPLFGESVLSLCNRLKECGCTCTGVDALTEDARYLDDMAGMFRESGPLDAQAELLGDRRYDMVIVGSNLEQCRDLRAVLHTAAERLETGGLLLMQYQNPASFAVLSTLLRGIPLRNQRFQHDPMENPMLTYVTEESIAALLEQEGMALQQAVRLTNGEWKSTIGKILQRLGLSGNTGIKDQLLTAAAFCIWKKCAVN